MLQWQPSYLCSQQAFCCLGLSGWSHCTASVTPAALSMCGESAQSWSLWDKKFQGS